MDRASHHHWGSSLSLTLGWGRQTVLKKGINDKKSTCQWWRVGVDMLGLGLAITGVGTGGTLLGREKMKDK